MECILSCVINKVAYQRDVLYALTVQGCWHLCCNIISFFIPPCFVPLFTHNIISDFLVYRFIVCCCIVFLSFLYFSNNFIGYLLFLLFGLPQRRATFSERGPDETSGAARGSEWQTKTPNWGCNPMYILQYFYCKAGISVRRLVLRVMKKYFNVQLDGWARQQKNVIEMGVWERRRDFVYFILEKSCSQQ